MSDELMMMIYYSCDISRVIGAWTWGVHIFGYASSTALTMAMFCWLVHFGPDYLNNSRVDCQNKWYRHSTQKNVV